MPVKPVKSMQQKKRERLFAFSHKGVPTVIKKHIAKTRAKRIFKKFEKVMALETLKPKTVSLSPSGGAHRSTGGASRPKLTGAVKIGNRNKKKK